MNEEYPSNDQIDETEIEDEQSSKLSNAKKGAAAAGALALGTGVASAQSGDPSVLVFSYQYYPNVKFKVRQQLTASTTVQLLKRPNGSEVPEITSPDNYNGYVIDYRVGQNSNNTGIVAFMFTKSSVNNGSTWKLSGNAQIFSSELNLLEANANSA